MLAQHLCQRTSIPSERAKGNTGDVRRKGSFSIDSSSRVRHLAPPMPFMKSFLVNLAGNDFTTLDSSGATLSPIRAMTWGSAGKRYTVHWLQIGLTTSSPCHRPSDHPSCHPSCHPSERLCCLPQNHHLRSPFPHSSFPRHPRLLPPLLLT